LILQQLFVINLLANTARYTQGWNGIQNAASLGLILILQQQCPSTLCLLQIILFEYYSG